MNDFDISNNAKKLPILEIANFLDIDDENVEQYGKYKAKIDFTKYSNLSEKGKLILVTSINPTPLGEGKSTVTVGLADALKKLEYKSVVCMREPSLGPVLGTKGGACGGGYAQLVPMEDINLHFTGDMHAITTANNLVSAMIDNSIYHGNKLNIDPSRIIFNRTIDLNDRALRNIEVSLKEKKVDKRTDSFDITAASQIMATLCMSESLKDFTSRVSNISIAYTKDNKMLTVKDLGIEGSISVIMKDAIKPNLVQTLENTPALIHGGPFANIAHGTNSIISTKLGLKLADYVVTEAGFGADLGAEKYFDIVCRNAGFNPSLVVIVATIKALKMHGGTSIDDLNCEDIESLKNGFSNLEKHIENVRKFNLDYIVAINKYDTDTVNEIGCLSKLLEDNGHQFSLCDVYASGSNGALDLAFKSLEIINKSNSLLVPLYDNKESIKEKIEKICKEIYGANGVIYSEKAESQIKDYSSNGFDKLPICMSKTQYSLSDNPKLLGRPTDFSVTISELKLSLGAGFIVCLTNKVYTMPGLSESPACTKIIFNNDKIEGLF